MEKDKTKIENEVVNFSILKDLFEAKPYFFEDCFFIVSNNSVDNPELYFGNIEKISGYSIQEIQALPNGFQSLIHPEDIENYNKHILELASKGTEEFSEHIFRIITKEDEIVWLKEKLYVKNDINGIKFEKFICDVSSFKKKEEELLKQYLTANEQNNIKDKFISIIAHDLRAPFTSLIGFSEILLNEPDLAPEEREDYLKYIYDAAQTQLALVQHLLDWSRLQSGKIEVEPARLNVKMAVSNAVASLTGAAVRKGVDIEIDIDENLYFYADPKLIDRVIGNLLSNALKFTPTGKKIYVTANYYGKDKIEVIVKDEGVGIKESDKHKIFKLGEKLTTTGTAGEKGTGLGLTLAKEIVEKHGGEIWFFSEEGKGTEFHFTIPEAKQIFLIVDDDKRARELFKKHIKNTFPDSEIIEADNGYEALNEAYKKIPSMIILDHDMPLMNGIQFLEVIKKNAKLKNVPVIIISAALDEETISNYKKLEVSEIIEKPFETTKFLEVIKIFN